MFASNLVGTPIKTNSTTATGLVYYQAGIAVLTASVLMSGSTLGISASSGITEVQVDLAGQTMYQALTSSALSASCDNVRHRINNIQFNNTTELNSTIYFCRAGTSEFNYSSNPTYVSGSEIINKNSDEENLPTSYITTVGLYSDANQLLAVGKLSEPLKKTPENELTLRVRLDY